jgi:hypothetical protein
MDGRESREGGAHLPLGLAGLFETDIFKVDFGVGDAGVDGMDEAMNAGADDGDVRLGEDSLTGIVGV